MRFGVFAGLLLLNAACSGWCLKAELKSGLKHLIKKEKHLAEKELKALFHKLDKNKDNALSIDEFENSSLAKHFGDKVAIHFGGISLETVDKVFKHLDTDNSKSLSWEELTFHANVDGEFVEHSSPKTYKHGTVKHDTVADVDARMDAQEAVGTKDVPAKNVPAKKDGGTKDFPAKNVPAKKDGTVHGMAAQGSNEVPNSKVLGLSRLAAPIAAAVALIACAVYACRSHRKHQTTDSLASQDFSAITETSDTPVVATVVPTAAPTSSHPSNLNSVLVGEAAL